MSWYNSYHSENNIYQQLCVVLYIANNNTKINPKILFKNEPIKQKTCSILSFVRPEWWNNWFTNSYHKQLFGFGIKKLLF